uniref:Putative ABC transport system permease protein n=1 Tax=Candidatus Kentrum sp. FW TaxID=2126338 RepID=A0A450U359_9GAMM|nr:MAG: putative ABC transport system permease protein [Candidatus Kentron sp. FW]
MWRELPSIIQLGIKSLLLHKPRSGLTMLGVVSGDIFIPITAAKGRFGERNIKRTAGSWVSEQVALHELQARVRDRERIGATAGAIRAMLARFHKKPDVEVIVPLELLAQARETQRLFTIVLGSIAAISLLVGGIGIMNIVLASVTLNAPAKSVSAAPSGRGNDTSSYSSRWKPWCSRYAAG